MEIKVSYNKDNDAREEKTKHQIYWIDYINDIRKLASYVNIDTQEMTVKVPSLIDVMTLPAQQGTGFSYVNRK